MRSEEEGEEEEEVLEEEEDGGGAKSDSPRTTVPLYTPLILPSSTFFIRAGVDG